jgi:hypothetical protein
MLLNRRPFMHLLAARLALTEAAPGSAAPPAERAEAAARRGT